VVIPSTDEKPIILTPPKPKAVAKEAPKSKPVAEAAAPAPKTYSLDHLIFDEKPVAPSAPPVVAPTPMPMPVAAPAVETSTESPKAMPVPVVTPPVVTAPSDEPMPLTKTAPPQPKQIMWTDRARDMAQKFGLTITTTQAESLSWQKDTLNGNAYHYTGDDVIDTANIALDEAQEKCKGTFDSQLGIPETYGTVTVQPIESKCVTGTDTHVSTWLLIQQDKDIVAWHIQTPRTQTTQAFALRDAMVAKLKGTMQ
jgi:hypothetical protein